MQNLKAKNAVITVFAKKEKEKNRPIIPLNSHITGRVTTAAINITIIPIFSIGVKTDTINKMNVKPAKIPRKYKKYALNVMFEKRSNIITNSNQETMKRITIINNNVFFDKFFNPEINLIMKTLEDGFDIKLFNHSYFN